jgi:hypothetical protein
VRRASLENHLHGLPQQAECQVAATQDHLISKGLRNGELVDIGCMANL